MFSARTSWDLTPNRYARTLARRRREGRTELDLTASNPTRVGLAAPAASLLDALAEPASVHYDPTPRGLPTARAAVARYYADRGVAIDPDRIVLTASTSDGYSYLLKLLADGGDEIAAPRPSYPLLEYLARLDGVALRRYPLHYDRRWSIDLTALVSALTDRTRAIAIVSPNNPTGSVATAAELATLDDCAAGHGAALLSDEVFADFTTATTGPPVAAATATEALTFTLSGLSKVCGLPQLKLAWIVVGGPDNRVAQALARLDVLADTYLSVATPVQLALPALLAGRHAFQTACRARLASNRAHLGARLSERPELELLAADGGWYACLRVPRLEPEEDLAQRLLEAEGIAVHPGYFFDFAAEAYLVISLLTPADEFAQGVARLLRAV